ncbi:hypothetical protein DMH25_35490 [Streptomyces sp. WAC 01325]|uniref:hypothetical protein n=1 Tax=Streptomyces sp. WAC 01325 TaxID=2203202 RepID=UPI000F891CCC|nr:hypothetical protein [Streptomyces sp. WAC 01325]RSM93315.1 hypothetical protein DMH25_35490 [Streptomyces sp. WAC 01325]
MPLSTDARALLTLISASLDPVVMSDFFEDLNPAEPGMNEGHPGHEAWLRRKIDWHRVSVKLWEQNLVRVVIPATASAATWWKPPRRDWPH